MSCRASRLSSASAKTERTSTGATSHAARTTALTPPECGERGQHELCQDRCANHCMCGGGQGKQRRAGIDVYDKTPNQSYVGRT